MTIRVKVTPRATKSEVVGKMTDGTLKVRIAAPPEKGKANAELCDLLARHFGVASSAVSVVSGQSSSRKLVKILEPS